MMKMRIIMMVVRCSQMKMMMKNPMKARYNMRYQIIIQGRVEEDTILEADIIIRERVVDDCVLVKL